VNEKLSALYSQTFSKSENRFVEYASRLGHPGWKLVATISSGGNQPQTTALLQQADDAIRRSLKHPLVFYRLDYDLGSGAPKGAQPYGYLVEVDGEYRFLGNTLVQAIPGVPVGRIRQGGAVTAASLIDGVPPQYPASARENRVSGTVRLHVIIGTDGAVKQIEILSGDPLLQQASIDAVRQWRYRQTMLNGEPVEVDSVIDIVFQFK
jgi:TonB family protein